MVNPDHKDRFRLTEVDITLLVDLPLLRLGQNMYPAVRGVTVSNLRTWP